MTERELQRYLQDLADEICRKRHPIFYNQRMRPPVWLGIGPPCDRCTNEVKQLYHKRVEREHGRKLTDLEVLSIKLDLRVEQ